MADKVHDGAEDTEAARAFLMCVTEVARLLAADVDVDRPGATTRRKAPHLANRVRRPLFESPHLEEGPFAPLMATAVHEPGPSFSRRFIAPALYSFGRPRVLEALVEYLRPGTDFERAGATRAWYWAQMPLSAARSTAPVQDGTQSELDASQEVLEAWYEVSMQIYAAATEMSPGRGEFGASRAARARHSELVEGVPVGLSSHAARAYARRREPFSPTARILDRGSRTVTRRRGSLPRVRWRRCPRIVR
jgi:hypothetical protein